MNVAAPQPKASKAAAPQRNAPACDCAEGGQTEAAGLPRFLSRFGAGSGGCGVQAKLTVGRNDDPFEREADALADAVMRDEPVAVPGAGTGVPGVQRLCAECAAEAADDTLADGLVQRAADGGAAAAAPAAAEPAVDSGSPLVPTVRSRLESSLGADLGDVRVHSGPAAQGMAQALHAKAFTHGEHIWLGPQQRADDLPLMAHEVAHVMQQGSGRARPDAVQRAPADYRHPEDGGGVLGRMQARISAATEGHEDEQPTGDAAAQAHAARSAAGGVDRGELAQERGTLEPQAKPGVDRPAQEAPKVQEAKAQTEQEADAPSEPLAEAEGKEGGDAKGGEGGKGGKSALADGGAGQAQSAFGAAAGVAMPAPQMPVTPPQAVSAPTDAGGQPLPGDPDADMQIAGLATQAQTLRDESSRIRSLAGEERRNSQTLRGNLALVRGGIMQAELGVARSQEHLAFRQDLAGQARQGLAVSEEKAATVAAEAPNFSSKADEGKAESGPMASEAGSLAAENAANTPDDAEAAADSREQGNAMNQAGSDIGTTDDAVTQTRTKADSLGADAAQAQQQNQATQVKLDGMQETLSATSEKLGQMGEQSGQARGAMEGLAGAPDTHAQQAAAIDNRGEDLANTSQQIETRLQSTQADYAASMAAVPAAEPWTREKVIELYGEEALEEPAAEGADAEAGPVAEAPAVEEALAEEPAAPAPDSGADDLLVQRTPADSGEVETPPPPPPAAPDAAAAAGDAGAGDAGADGGADAGGAPADAASAAGDAGAPADTAAGTGADAGMPGAEAGPLPGEGDAAPADAAPAAPDPAAPAAAAAPPERERVDAAGAVSGALPSWLTGVEPPNEEARERAAQEAADRRAAQIAEIEGESGNGFASMTATDRMGWALRQTGRNLFGSVGNIQWPGFGHLALGLIDPRGPMMGVVSGLGMMLSGGANLLSGEQWRRDPLGNLLKSAADIATGLTIVLGSITALAGVIIAIMTAITILSFGTAAPVTGPVIAFCTTVLTTVGGWTIAVGKVALVLQALVFIKNLIDAACAQTAAELQAEADQMTENVSDAGNVLMQMGMAKAGQLGGRAASAEIRAAGGGVRYAAQMGARAGVGVRSGLSATGRALGRGAAATGRGLRALPGAAVRGARALPGAVARGARAAPGAIGRGTVAAGRAIGRGTVAAGRAVGRGTVAAGRAIGRGTVAAGRAIGRGTVAAGRAVGRGISAVGRGARALPGAALRGARALPGAVARGVRALPGAVVRGARALPGTIGRGARAAWRGTREYFGSRFSRSFIVGDDIANLGMARSASAEARAAVWAEARAPGGALAGEARVAGAADDVHVPGAADDVHAPGAVDDAIPPSAESRARVEETPPARGAERDASVSRSSRMESDQITPQDAANEVAHVSDHPELVRGRAPNRRAAVGEHEIVEVPGIGCERRSNGRLSVPCPVSFGDDAAASVRAVRLTVQQESLYRGFLARLERSGLSTEEALAQLGLRSEDELRAIVSGARSADELRQLLGARAERAGVTARAEMQAAQPEAAARLDEGFEAGSTVRSADDLGDLARATRPMPTAAERRLLQDATDEVYARLISDPHEMARYLSRGELEALARDPGRLARDFGNAMERALADELATRADLSRFLHIPQRRGVSTPDIGTVAPRPGGPMAYDLTTANPRAIASHNARSYGPVTELVTYPSVPRGFRLPNEVFERLGFPVDRSASTSGAVDLAAAAGLPRFLQQRQGAGSPLPHAGRERMERHLGTELEAVRLHTDEPAASMSEGLQADAFTMGSDIFFGRGRFDTSGMQGRRLLAHEVVHAVQNQEGGMRETRPATDTKEREASAEALAPDLGDAMTAVQKQGAGITAVAKPAAARPAT
jgi:hypothetical protein